VKSKVYLSALTFAASSTLMLAQTASPIQSAARPYGLSIVNTVQVAGSDASSATFQSDVLPGMLDAINLNLSESASVSDLSSISLDPGKLVLGYDSNVRVYFLGEGAGYRNSLGFTTSGNSPLSPDAKLIFPDASANTGYGGNGSSVRSTSAPVLAGDFVDLGSFTAGTNLDFFLIANGATGGRQFFSTNQAANSDGIIHAVSLAQNGSAYLIIGFEDVLKGGDKDYNDLVFAVEIGRQNVEHLVRLSAPEPSLAIGSALAGVAMFGARRRRSRF